MTRSPRYSVTLSRAERDALVAMARDGLCALAMKDALKRIIEKPRARQEGDMWLVWCAAVVPSPRATFESAYLAWARRRGWLV